MSRRQRLNNLKRPLLQGAVCLLLLSLVGGEYYRYTLTTRATDQEQKAKQMQQAVQDLRVREQRLQPDLALMERLDQTFINPKDGNLSQQLLARVIADQQTADADLQSVMVGQRGVLNSITRHGLAVQLRGTGETIIAYIRELETGPAAARVAGFNFRQVEAAAPGEDQLANLSIEYYSKPR